MENLLVFICENAEHAHWILLGLLILAGLNFPFSEDIILLTGGVIASTCIPEHATRLFIWIWLGCYFSAWEAYWIGRLLGPKLYTIRWFSHVITPHRIERINHYYEKFGILTFIVGRFIPGGVRNCLFMSAGLGKMPFNKFIVRDGVACFISSSTLFHIGYYFSENYDQLLSYFKSYSHVVFFIIGTILICATLYFWLKTKSNGSTNN